MVKYLLIVLLALSGISCATLIERGKVTQDEYGNNVYTPEEYIKVKGIGKGEFPSGHKIEGKPMVEMPQLPKMEFEK